MGLYGGLTVEDIHTKKNLKENSFNTDYEAGEDNANN